MVATFYTYYDKSNRIRKLQILSDPKCHVAMCRTLESDFSQTIYERIHVRGCVTTIKESLHTYVLPMLLAWALLGTYHKVISYI